MADAPFLAIVSFRGDPTEGCYQVQAPALPRGKSETLRGIHER